MPPPKPFWRDWRIVHEAARKHDDMVALAMTAPQPIVGIIGDVVPTELIVAAGCRPRRLWARAEDFARDSAPMEREHEGEVRSLFIQAAEGAFSECDLL